MGVLFGPFDDHSISIVCKQDIYTYIYIYIYICATAGEEIQIEPLNSCSLRAARIRRSDFYVFTQKCIYIYILIIYIYTVASMHLCIHASMHLCICAPYASMHPWIYASMHLCIYASMHLCMYASMHLCTVLLAWHN